MKPIIQIGSLALDPIHVGLIVFALVVAGVTLRMRGKHSDALRDLDHALERESEDNQRLSDTLGETEQKLLTQQAIADEAKLKLAAAEARSSEDEKKFADLAQGVLRQANNQFLQLANETFAKHKEGAKGDLEKLVQPIGDTLKNFSEKVTKLEEVRTKDKSAIEQQVKSIGESLMRNTAETGKLVNALTAPKGGGRWGEMTLRNVMEQAGLSGHCDFNEQVNDQTEDGNQRPDAVIHLPGKRQIVVDSKVSLESYMAASSASDPGQRSAHLKAHAASVQRHINALASRRYQDNLDERVDFVAMFIPGENFFAAALEYAPDLLERAYAKNVIVTTPSTLIGLAKTVSYVWRQEKMTENAREAAKLGEDLYSRIATMAAHIERLGKSLNSSVDHYNKMNSSLDKRVMPTMRKLEELSIAQPDKAMPEPKRIETTADERAPMLDFDSEASDVAAE